MPPKPSTSAGRSSRLQPRRQCRTDTWTERTVIIAKPSVTAPYTYFIDRSTTVMFRFAIFGSSSTDSQVP